MEKNTPVRPKEKALIPVEEKSLVERKKTTFKEKIKKIPEKKSHLDFIIAVLTIPVLIITLYLNISNLKNKPASSLTPTPTLKETPSENIAPQVSKIVITATPQPTANTNSCIKDIGPISIDSPTEEQNVSTNPVCIDINYQAGNYCSVVWAYRVNNGNWSDYSNNSVCLYNLPAGTNTFDLQIKSLSSASMKTLHRTFTYTPQVTPTITQSATAAPTPTITQ